MQCYKNISGLFFLDILNGRFYPEDGNLLIENLFVYVYKIFVIIFVVKVHALLPSQVFIKCFHCYAQFPSVLCTKGGHQGYKGLERGKQESVFLNVLRMALIP